MVVIISHRGVAFGAVKSCSLGRDGISVPILRRTRPAGAGRVAGAAADRVGGRVPSYAIAPVKERHTIDKDPDVAGVGLYWCAGIGDGRQGNFENSSLIGRLRRIAILKRTRRVGRYTSGGDIDKVNIVFYLLAVDENIVVNGDRIIDHVVTAGLSSILKPGSDGRA